MHSVVILQSLVLLILANGTPIVAKKILGGRFSRSLDGGLKFIDRRPLFGSAKTIRGILVSILITAAGAPLVGVQPKVGALVVITAMVGDLFSSFVKRRLNFRPSSQALGLDQVPESLLPLLACRDRLSLTVADIALAVLIFFVCELILSRILYKAHLRDEPY